MRADHCAEWPQPLGRVPACSWLLNRYTLGIRDKHNSQTEALQMIIYVGDGSDMIGRIKSNHCSGNVEGSALRQCVAKAKGFQLSCEKRPSGAVKIRIASPDPRRDENIVSVYIRAGSWRLVSCDSYDEAHDFQWFVIEHLNPLCNVTRKAWDQGKAVRYQQLLGHLTTSSLMSYADVRVSRLKLPGVYVLEHPNRPDA